MSSGQLKALMIIIIVIAAASLTSNAYFLIRQTSVTTSTTATGSTSSFLAQLIRDATSEGQLTFYAPYTPQQVQALASDFQNAYPGMKAEGIPYDTATLVSKWSTEVTAKKGIADVVIGGSAPTYYLGLQQHQEMFLATPEYENYPYVPYSTDPGWWGITPIVQVFAYNNKVLTGPNVPTGFADLAAKVRADPSFWKGKIVIVDPRQDFASLAVQYAYLKRFGDTTYWNWIATFAKDGMATVGSNGALLQGLASGQFALGFSPYFGDVLSYINQQAPIGIIYPDEGAVVGVGGFAISSVAPHPNSGKLFMNWLLSKAGQLALAKDVGVFISFRTDITPQDMSGALGFTPPVFSYNASVPWPPLLSGHTTTPLAYIPSDRAAMLAYANTFKDQFTKAMSGT